MIQNKKQFFKRVVEVLVVLLGIFSALLFVKAVFIGRKINDSFEPDTQIRVFINQNDSIVKILHENGEHLSPLFVKMQTDKIIIEIKKSEVSE